MKTKKVNKKTSTSHSFSPISDYYLIGDLHTAALVSNSGSIDWLCLPHFDSPGFFSKILDANGGCFRLNNNTSIIKHGYLENTPITNCQIKIDNTSVTLHDFMVPQEIKHCQNHFLIRKLIGGQKDTTISFVYTPKPNFAQSKNKSTYSKKQNQIKTRLKTGTVTIHLPPQSQIEQNNNSFIISIELKKRKTQQLVIEYAAKETFCAIDKNQDYLKTTIQFWKSWIKRGSFSNFNAQYQTQLIRSAITLKLMQYFPTGALIASPTTSLPEEIGGSRNWDYRYVWIRDATFTLNSFVTLGYYEEAEKFFDFVDHIVRDQDEDSFEINLLYDIFGNRVSDETTLDHLSGYQHSQPVRIGNGANTQFQLDVYGTLIDSFFYATQHDITQRPLRKKLILRLIKKINRSWLKKDNGIWEVRENQQHYTYSKVMSWVGVHRALEMADDLHFSFEDKVLCETLEKEIYSWIWQYCFDPHTQILKQHPQTSSQDATNFLFVHLGFLDPQDKLTRSIIENTQDELCYNQVFVHRYKNHDGLPGNEGSFILCSYWLIAAYAAMGNHQKAKQLYQKLEQFMPEHGLMAEEIDPQTKEFLGNYPQAFSHMGEIIAVHYFKQRKNG